MASLIKYLFTLSGREIWFIKNKKLPYAMIGIHRWAQMSWREEAGPEDYEKPAHQWSQTFVAPAIPLITGGNTVG